MKSSPLNCTQILNNLLQETDIIMLDIEALWLNKGKRFVEKYTSVGWIHYILVILAQVKTYEPLTDSRAQY